MTDVLNELAAEALALVARCLHRLGLRSLGARLHQTAELSVFLGWRVAVLRRV